LRSGASKKMKHTKTPWKMHVDATGNLYLISSSSGNFIPIARLNWGMLEGKPNKKHKIDAQFIIEAVNNHDELVEALEDIKSKLEDYFAGRINIRPDYLEKVNQALVNLEEEQIKCPNQQPNK